ncbi:hypothetical protein [Nocardia vaccinii]|uniref:hypothetical protein n=1 Tax=Nocardia vaccinii TaxID=1822 RepID=UPI00082BF35A|nr:hypothetical protein [Nocardia vaccinii]
MTNPSLRDRLAAATAALDAITEAVASHAEQVALAMTAAEAGWQGHAAEVFGWHQVASGELATEVSDRITALHAALDREGTGHPN